MSKIYAVKNGRINGIFTTWDECKKQVDGFKGAQYKSFADYSEATQYLENSKTNNVIEEKEGIVKFYIDGSYNPKTRAYGAGIVILQNNTKKTLSFSGDDEEESKMRNVAGELLAAVSTLNYIMQNSIPEAIIYYDYEGIEKWCNGEWEAKKNGTILYQTIFKKAAKNSHIQFKKIKSHSQDQYNDEADMLAKTAINVPLR